MPDPVPHCAVELELALPALSLRCRFELHAPWSILFGASGSGKSTLLRAIAGLAEPQHGRIALGGNAVLDTDLGLSLPAHRRPVRAAPQAAALLPDRSVRGNLLFPNPGTPFLAEVADLLHVDQLLHRRPNQLSGGEQQRVNVARAVLAASACRTPPLLLLDEPFAGMDSDLRNTLAPTLAAWLAARRIPVLSVTHDLGEAFLIRPEVLRLEHGRLTAQGPPEQVLAADRDALLTLLQAPGRQA